MTSDDLDRILLSSDTVQPSSAFTKTVMAAVHREAVELPRPSFPWMRFGIGVFACSVMAASATALLTGVQATATIADVAGPVAAVAPELSYGAAVILVGLGVSAIPRALSRF